MRRRSIRSALSRRELDPLIAGNPVGGSDTQGCPYGGVGQRVLVN